jgi:hypothetical protein
LPVLAKQVRIGVVSVTRERVRLDLFGVPEKVPADLPSLWSSRPSIKYLRRGRSISQEVADELETVMNQLQPDLQRNLATLSTNGCHIEVADSGHFTQVDRPRQ